METGASAEEEPGYAVETADAGVGDVDMAAAEPLTSDDPLSSKAEPGPAQADQNGTQNGSDEKEDRHGSSDRRDRDREHKDKDKSRDKDRERDRDRERGRDRKEKEKDRGRDRKDSKRSKDDDREGKDSKRSRRSRSREKSRRDSRERRSSRRSRSKSRRRSRSKERRRSKSRDRQRRRSRSRSRDRRSKHRSRRRSYSSSSDDAFGGYVPRKRQEPPQAAAGYSTAFVDPYAALRSKVAMPTDPEGIKRQMQEQQLRARQMVLQQQASSAVAAASKTQREIYVGNLVQGLVTEDALKQLFNSTMKAAFPEQQVVGMDPVVNVSMHSEGRYAFVELRTPEMASAALQLSGQVQLLGQNISVGRPSGYVDPSAAQMAAAQAATALQAYESGQMTLEEATSAMNTITMPGVSASQPPGQGGVSPSPTNTLALPAPPPVPAPAPAPVSGSEPAAAVTPFLQVEGMVTAEVLADDEEYAEVVDDLQEECGKFGQILKVVVPRPPNPAIAASVFGQGNYGKAFVHFADEVGCSKAKAAIHGRLFAGVTVQANFVNEQTFATCTAGNP